MQFYSQPCLWGLSDCFWTHPELFIIDIKQLRPCAESDSKITGVYFAGNHPVRSVKVQGIVTGVDLRHSNVQFTMDDGTGSIGVVVWTKNAIASEDQLMKIASKTPAELKQEFIGQLMSVNGRISEFRDKRQLNAFEYRIETDPNAEPLHFAKVLHLRRQLFNISFQLADSLVQISEKLDHYLNCGPLDITDEDCDRFISLSKIHDSPVVFMQECLPFITTKSEFRSVLELVITKLYEMEFTFNQLLNDCQELIVAARQVLQIKSAFDRHDEASKLRVQALFGENLSLMVKDGKLYLKDSELDLYGLIGHDINLGEDILNIVVSTKQRSTDIKDETETDSEIAQLLAQLPRISRKRSEPVLQSQGITEDEIIRRIQSCLKYRHVPRRAIIKSIQRLVDESEIYEYAYKEYKRL